MKFLPRIQSTFGFPDYCLQSCFGTLAKDSVEVFRFLQGARLKEILLPLLSFIEVERILEQPV
jgi:hypothetical protein